MSPSIVSTKNLRTIIFIIIYSFLIPILATPGGTKAQADEKAWLTSPLTEKFPLMETYLVVFDQSGNFFHNLNVTQIVLFEDGNQLPLVGLQEQRPGVQVVVAIDPGPSFAIQNSQAVSRYDFVIQALGKWGNSRLGTTIDDLSLLTTNGASISHSSNPLEFLNVLSAEQIDARTAVPDLDSLFRAVSLAADPTLRPGMGRAVLYITPPPDGIPNDTFENIITQAKIQGVRIFVWMVASPGTYAEGSQSQLVNLAERTGGHFFNFSGEEILPDPESYFEPLRNIYHLSYESRIKNTGSHQLYAQIQTNSGKLNTPEQNFEFDIQPPIPTFISPPLSILRSYPMERGFETIGETETDKFTPREQIISMVVDFPDGRIRAVVRSALYIDGVLVAENRNPPFDQFVWNIANYNTDGVHMLQVEVEDMLGLTGRSTEIPVEIKLEMPEPSPWTAVYNNLPLITSLAVLMAGMVLFLVFVIAGRLHPSLPKRFSKRRWKGDPVTQVVNIGDGPKPQGKTRLVDQLKWGSKHEPSKVAALLNPLSETDPTPSIAPIPIATRELTIGKNPERVDLVLDDPSIEDMHARITRNQDGTFRIADEKTIAGTWINFTPVSHEGTKLEHGDLIHIGRIGFRFTLCEPSPVHEPTIIKINQVN